MRSAGAKESKILVVEDEPAICRVCSRTLTSEGFEVDIAVNGSLADDMLESGKNYDLILIDIRTPVMNGRQLYESIVKKHPELVSRVIFTTGDVIGDNKSFLEESGRLYLPKPFTPDDLKTIVEEALRQLEK